MLEEILDEARSIITYFEAALDVVPASLQDFVQDQLVKAHEHYERMSNASNN